MTRPIYLDNNATTRPLDEVVEAMQPYLSEHYANPSSVHQFGQQIRHQIELAREKVAALINAGPREIVFTAGGTESINLAVRGLLGAYPAKRRVITSSVEHSATRSLCNRLGEEGVEIVELGVDELGRLDCEALDAALDEQTALVTLLYANNETGVLFDVEHIAVICERHDVPLHLDAVQAIGKAAVDVETLPVTLLSISAHKFHGPKGVGALYVRRRTRLSPMILGGSQERDLRAGTENVPGIIGMAAAGEAILNRDPGEFTRITELRDRLEDGLLRAVPSARINGDRDRRVCNTTNIGFPGASAEGLLILLSEQGICASAGSACSSGSLEPSHVLAAMNADRLIVHGSIRLSLSKFTTQQEIDRVVSVIPTLLSRLGALRSTDRVR